MIGLSSKLIVASQGYCIPSTILLLLLLNPSSLTIFGFFQEIKMCIQIYLGSTVAAAIAVDTKMLISQ